MSGGEILLPKLSRLQLSHCVIVDEDTESVCCEGTAIEMKGHGKLQSAAQ
jgi:hypothetical protein